MTTYAFVGPHKILLTPLDVIRIVATRVGFDDVDFEPLVEGFTVTASGGRGDSITVRGGTVLEVAERFCDRCLT